MIGRKRAFAIGCVIYGCGSLTTALAPNLYVLLLGWSLLEGIGAALILPAIVALVAGNFGPERRPAAYGLVAAAGAVAVAVGPLIGGLHDVFPGGGLCRRGRAGARHPAHDAADRRRAGRGAPAARRGRGRALGARPRRPRSSASRDPRSGLIQPTVDGPSWAGLSPTIWLVLAGLFVIWPFFRWEAYRESKGREPLVRPAMFRNRQLTSGLTMFFFQYLVQAGFFFVVPLFLSVALGLSAIDTGVRLLPLSVTLLAAAIGSRGSRTSRGWSSASAYLLLVRCRAARSAGHRRRGGDRLRADAPRRARHRRARLPARRRHGVRGARRREP